MKIYVDGVYDVVAFSSEEDILGDILKGVQDFVGSHKKAILKMELDGKLFSIDDKDLLKKPLKSFKRLDITTCLISQLSELSLKEVKKTIAVFKKAFEDIAVLVQERNIKSALEKFITTIDEWRQLIETFIQTLSFIKYDLDKPLIKKQSVNSLLKTLKGLYEELSEAFKNEDWILLADLLEYEIAPKTDDYAKIVDKIVKEIKKPK